MNGVLGMIEVLERQGLSKDQRRILVTMRESAQALLCIIDDVLDFSKIEAGRLEARGHNFLAERPGRRGTRYIPAAGAC